LNLSTVISVYNFFSIFLPKLIPVKKVLNFLLGTGFSYGGYGAPGAGPSYYYEAAGYRQVNTSINDVVKTI